MDLGNTTGARISSLDAVGQQPLLVQCADLDAGVQNLIYGYGDVPQTTIDSSHTLPIHCDEEGQQSVDMSIQFPTGLQCDPVQMAEVVQHDYVLIGGAWMYPRVNVANTVHL